MQSQAISPATKRDRRDKTYGSLEAFPEFFEKFVPPTGAFDPRGAWKVSYGVWLFAGDPGAVGFLEIERQPGADGAALKVATRVAHLNGYQQQSAELGCAADTLSSLRWLTLESVSGTPEGTPVPATRTSVRVEVRGGAVQFTRGERRRSARAAPPVVASWGLMEALQRLSPEPPSALEFTLLDDGDLLKPAQRVTYAGKTSIQAAGGAGLTLHCWEHTGYGMLPAHYWRDAQGRLLFVVAGQRAYLYDPAAREHAAGRRRRKQA
jgi:hypothetical protein